MGEDQDDLLRSAKRVPAVFYKAVNGTEPVRDWLKNDLNEQDRKSVGRDISNVEHGWPVGMPLCKSVGEGLWEVRSGISDKRTTRVIVFIHQGSLVLLHGFIKKTEKTASSDLQLARKRKKEVERGE